MSGESRSRGFSLLEILVALVILELSMLGVVGLLALASARLKRAQQTERAAAVGAGVADSLSLLGESGSGESIRGDWRVAWQAADEGGLVLTVSLLEDPARDPVLELRLP